MIRRLRLPFVILALSLALFAAESPFSGTWKLNLAKSKLPPPAPQSDIAKVDADDNGLKFSEDITDDKGQSVKVTFEAQFDGKNYPVTGDPWSVMKPDGLPMSREVRETWYTRHHATTRC